MKHDLSVAAIALLAVTATAQQQAPNPRQQPGAMVHIFAPEQHDLYDGHFVISAGRLYMVGGLNDPEGFDHLDNEAKAVKPVTGTAEIDVNEVQNTGTFEARPEDATRRLSHGRQETAWRRDESRDPAD
jgi:hypothetical protein